MAFANVIPIDADVARQLARRQVRFRWLVAGLTALWIAIVIPTLVLTPLPPLAPFMALAALVVLAEHRFVLFGDETSMSASIIVIVASIFVFADTSPLAGPLLIASIGGIYIPHLKSRAFCKIAFNGTAMGISAWLASAAVLVAPWDGVPSGLGAPLVLGAVLVYWTFNNLAVAGHQATLCGASFVRSAKSLISTDTDALLWAGAGGIAVAAAGSRTNAGVAFVACVVALRIATMARRGQGRLWGGASTAEYRLIFWLSAVPIFTLQGDLSVGAVAVCLSVALLLGRRPSHPSPLVAVWMPLLPILLAGTGSIALRCIGLATVAASSRWRNATNAWTYSITIGVTVASVSMGPWHPLVQVNMASALVCAALAPLVASTAFAVLITRRAHSSGLWVAVGMIVPAGRDIVAMAMTALLALGTPHAPLVTLNLITAFFAAAAVFPRSSTREVR